MPRGHEHISFVFSSAFRVPCLDVIMMAFFPRNIQWKTIILILNKKKAIIITFKHGTRIFFPITILF